MKCVQISSNGHNTSNPKVVRLTRRETWLTTAKPLIEWGWGCEKKPGNLPATR